MATATAPRTAAPPWHALAPTDVVAQLHTDPVRGLERAEARRRLVQYGRNVLQTSRVTPWYGVLARQFVDVLIVILLLAAAISLLLGEVTDAVTILAIVGLNGLLGFVQEWKAEQALAALQRLLAPRCRVVRDGREQDLEAAQLVPGDLVVLDTGDRVPADVRLLAAVNLRVDESALTGESAPVSKSPEAVPPETPLAERRGMVWMGTAVTNGRARGVVVATGMATEFGRIAQLTAAVGEERTPLQRKLAVLGMQLGLFAVGISVLVAAAGWLAGKPLLEMFLTGVSLAVAVVPEGLPAVVTITLALGVRAMVRRRALLRRLQAAETLGAATVICTDKTGTLTQNEMTVQRLWLPSGEVEVTGVGYTPSGRFLRQGKPLEPQQHPELLALLEAGWRCNHARLVQDAEGWHQIGEPTEAALLVAAAKAGFPLDKPEAAVAEFSFNSARKRMTVIEARPEGPVAFVKGAPEVILPRCTTIQASSGTRPLTPQERAACEQAYTAMAEAGLRTLALARRLLPPDLPWHEDAVEQALTLLGVVGLIDPPRPEVPAAVQLARTAGIRVLMVTGDAPGTALAIARRIGLHVARALTGQELEALDDEALRQILQQDVLFARTTPEQKLRLVTLLQAMGHVVAMTGDGVNDAPALKKADVGIAMGLRGTEVARGAADMILTDDNFASIVAAVEEGRRQYDNIQKFVRYLLSANTGEIAAVFANVLLGGPLILLPVQILWMNLVTDGVSAVALGVEPAEAGLMQRPPRRREAPVLDRQGILTILLLGGYMGGVALGLFQYALDHAPSLAWARSLAFTGLVVMQQVNALNFRTLRAPLAAVGAFSNPWLLLAVLSMLGLQAAAIYLPFLQRAFHTAPLAWTDWALLGAVAAPLFLVTEALKRWRWRRRRPVFDNPPAVA
ncbi:MAG: ATPase [Candidatus Tectimicrobiota bacterium]|nr:MAG: ATPase [Candidatus Tectomicrobia bacterium]